MLEMVIAMGIIAVVFAAILPQFANIRNGWDLRQAKADILQNGRILINYLRDNLARATKIIDISGPADTNGYIEFEDNNGDIYRFSVSAGGYVQFGQPGNLYDIAGPVNQLQFTGYPLDDMATSTTDVDLIRFVNIETTLLDEKLTGRQQTFKSSVYIQTNGHATDIGMGPPYEFEMLQGRRPTVIKIIGDYYLCVYSGPGNDGWAVVLSADKDTGVVTKVSSFEFDTVKSVIPVISEIEKGDGSNPSRFLCAYASKDDAGWAVVLNVDLNTWAITRETPLNFELDILEDPSLIHIKDTSFLCTYSYSNGTVLTRGIAVVLTVDEDTWEVTSQTPFEFDARCLAPALSKIKDENYLCAYTGPPNRRGWAVVLTVDTGTWDITKETPFEFDDVKCRTPALSRLDNEHYLCAYSGPPAREGWAVVLKVDESTWDITKGVPFQFDTLNGKMPALTRIKHLPSGASNRTDFLCAYTGDEQHGYAAILSVDTIGWTVSRGTPLDFDGFGSAQFSGSSARRIGLAEMDDTRFICVYSGGPFSNHGWTVVFDVAESVLP